MGLRGITISINGGQLSDLFFNFDHPKRDALYKPKDAEFTHEELEAAVRDDAAEFASIIGIENDEFVAELTADFIKRA